jgi:hypothetical protein
MRSSVAPDVNPDPITGAAGAHPIGTGTGAVGGAAAGAAIGTAVGGPVGFVVGGAAGAIAGGLAGKGVAEAINPTLEDEYWRENFSSRPYAQPTTTYETLEPAYRYGWESRGRSDGKEWKDIEADLGVGWDRARGTSRLAWADAKAATHDAWDHTTIDEQRMDDDGAIREVRV